MKQYEGYLKLKLDNSVLLSDGSHKPLSDFIGSLEYDQDTKTLKYKAVGDLDFTELFNLLSNSYLPLAGGTMTGAIIFSGGGSGGVNNTGHARIGEYDHTGGLVVQLGAGSGDATGSFEVINKPWDKAIFSAGYDGVSGYTSSLFISSSAPRGKFGDLNRYENSVPYQITATPQSSSWVLCVGANAGSVLLGAAGTYGKIGVHNNNPLRIVSNYVGIGSSTFSPQYQLDVEGKSRATGGAILGNVRVGLNSSNGVDNNACIELMTGSGYIDWHYNGSSADYTTRIIEGSSGALTLYGSLTVTGNTYSSNFYVTSDERKKKEIKQISNSIYQFKLKDLDILLYGYIAQELEKTNPELVDSSSEYKTVNYNSAICYNISKIENNMKTKIVELEQRLDKLESRGGQVKALIIPIYKERRYIA